MSLHISARTIPCMHLYVVVHTHRLQRRAKGNLPIAGSLHCSSSWQVQIQPMHVHELVPPIHVIRCAYTSTQPAIVFCSLLRLIGISSRKTLVCLYQYSLSAGGQPSASASGNIADANGWPSSSPQDWEIRIYPNERIRTKFRKRRGISLA